MDFSLSEEQEAFSELARQILADTCTKERLVEIERADGPRFDAKLWAKLAEAGLLGIAIPEPHTGAGLGLFELALIIEQVGAHAAPVPFLETLVLGALPIAEFGNDVQREAHLPRMASGRCIATAGLVEALTEIEHPQMRAAKSGDGFVLNGVKICVPAAQIADLILVAAQLEGQDGPAVFIVETTRGGITIEPVETTSGQPEARVTFAGVEVGPDALLGAADRGSEILEWIRQRATTAQCALSLGVCEAALQLTSEYTKTRKQFDQPIAMFQAVGQRMADAYVDTEAIRLTMWQAAWRLAAGEPAAAQVAAAKYWAAVGGQRVVHTATHQHGGMGVDRDYPLHRFFLYAKQLELSLGGMTAQLRRLGRMIAAGTA